MARAGNGTALFASLEERLEKKVMQQLQDALQPALTGIKTKQPINVHHVIRLIMKMATQKIEIKIKWEGYDETEQSTADVPVQTEKTLMGYGKPVDEPLATVTEKLEMKLRQAPCDSMVVSLRRNPMYFDNNTILSAQIPPVFDGRHLIVYALLALDAHIPKWADIIAVSPVGPLSLKIQLSEQNSEEGQLVHR